MKKATKGTKYQFWLFEIQARNRKCLEFNKEFDQYVEKQFCRKRLRFRLQQHFVQTLLKNVKLVF
jgi:hypothetical protein